MRHLTHLGGSVPGRKVRSSQVHRTMPKIFRNRKAAVQVGCINCPLVEGGINQISFDQLSLNHLSLNQLSLNQLSLDIDVY